MHDLQIPRIANIQARSFPDVESVQLSNGAEVIAIPEDHWQVFKMEVCFYAGRPYERTRGVARSHSSLLKNRTQNNDRRELSDFWESRGARMVTRMGADLVLCILSGPSQYFEELLPVFMELLEQPNFTSPDLTRHINRQKNRLATDLSASDVLTYRQLTEDLFGPDHPYGYNSVPETYDRISLEDIKVHHQTYFHPSRGKYILSGGLQPGMVELLKRRIESSGRDTATVPPGPVLTEPEMRTGLVRVTNQKRNQVSIRIGRGLGAMTDEALAPIYLASTVLGGYFGSHLMRRVREEEGLSYHIFSTVEVMYYDAYWMIGTETSRNNVRRVLELIRETIGELSEQSISGEEQKMVRNYMLGNSLQFFEGAFNRSDLIRSYLYEMGRPNGFDASMKALDRMDVDDIREAMGKYFAWPDARIVLSGKPE